MIAYRIISLLPACTEIACALGFGDQLVGRSHECDHPPEVLTAPVCTSARVNAEAPGGEIENEVKTLLEQGLSLFSIDLPRMQALRPELILTQAQCAVCAVSVADVERALAGWTGGRPRILSLAPRRLTDLWDNIREVAEALDAVERGRVVVRQLKERVTEVIFKTAGLKRRPSVACIEWLDPLMAAGNWVPELVELAGGSNQFGEAGEHSPWMKWEELVANDPEVVVLMPCGFPLDRTVREAAVLASRPEWKRLRAVKNGRVFAVDGHHYFNRPGPRLVDSLEILAEILNPGIFPPRYRGPAWRPLDRPQ